MKRGKKAFTDPVVRWEVSIPSSIASKIELLLLNPLTNKPKYAARTKLVTKLLQEWLAKQTV